MEEAIVSVHTRAANTDDILGNTECESAKNYFIEQFNDGTVQFGPAWRDVSLLYIQGQIDIIAHLIRTTEMARLHKELYSAADSKNTPGVFEICSFPLDKLAQQTEMLRMYLCLSALYKRIVYCNVDYVCSFVDTFFLEELPPGETHHYTSRCEESLSDNGTIGFCLCILIAEQEDKKFSHSLCITGETGTSTTYYHMSAGDTCILPGKSLFSSPGSGEQLCTALTFLLTQ
jgi:hypothetical protein